MTRASLTVRQKMDIAETIFRYQFLYNGSFQQQKAPAYFLSLLGKDPDQDFLKRFRGHKPTVRKGSEFAERKGLLFEVRSIRSLSKTKAKVSGGYYEHGLSSSVTTYLVEFKEGEWVVTGESYGVIS